MLLGAVVVVHLAVWALARTIAPIPFPTRQLVAEGFSSLAIVSLSLNLMLSTRAPVFERGLRGLDKLFVTHRTVGLSVAVLVTTHFLLVPKSVGPAPSKLPGYTTITLLLLAILIASAPRFPWRKLVPLRYQDWKATHRFMGLVVALAVTHSLLAHTYVKQVPLLTVYVYGIATLGLAAWLYRELAFRFVGPFHAMTVAGSRTLDGGVTELTLEPATAGALSRTAGQFAIASFAQGPSREQHPFTISSGAARDVRFSIKASGDFTRRLQGTVPLGSAVTLEGPYGAFDYRRATPLQVWIAGGIGITPFLAMARDLDAQTRVRLIWSVHDRAEAVYADELAALAAEKPNLEFTLHATTERGHLDAGALALDPAPASWSFFLCGPVPMRKALQRQLAGLGVARSRVHFEEFRLR